MTEEEIIERIRYILDNASGLALGQVIEYDSNNFTYTTGEILEALVTRIENEGVM